LFKKSHPNKQTVLRALGLLEKDLSKCVGLFIYNFSLGMMFVISFIVGDTLFLSRFDGNLFGYEGVKALPIIYIVGALISAALGGARIRFQDKLSVPFLVIGSLTLMTIGILVFYGLISLSSSTFVLPAFLVWNELCFFFLPFNSEVTANQILGARQSKRVLPIANAGTSCAYVVGSFSTSLLAPWIELRHLLLPAILFLLIGITVFIQLWRNNREFFSHTVHLNQHRHEQVPQPIWKNHLVLAISALAALLFFMFQIVEFQFQTITSLTFNETEIAVFFGIMIGSLGLGQVFLQLFIVNRIVLKEGIFLCLSMLPGALLLGSLWVLRSNESSIFFLLALVKCFDSLFRYTFTDSARPLLSQALPNYLKERSKSLEVGIIFPLVSAIGGFSLLFYTSSVDLTAARISTLSWWVLTAALLTLLLLYPLKSIYLKQLIDQGRKQGANSNGFKARYPKRELINYLLSGDPVAVRLALNQLDRQDIHEIDEELRVVLQSPNPSIQADTLKFIANRSLTNLAPQVDIIFNGGEANPQEVFLAAIKAYSAIHEDNALEVLNDHLSSDNPYIVSACAAALMQYCGMEGLLCAAPFLKSLLASEAKQDRLLAASIIKNGNLVSLRREIKKLMTDLDSEVQTASLDIISCLNVTNLYPDLIMELNNKKLKRRVKKAMLEIGPEILPICRKQFYAQADNTELRKAIIETAGKYADQDATDFLLEIIEHDNLFVRRWALRALFHDSSAIQCSAPQLGKLRVEESLLLFYRIGMIHVCVNKELPERLSVNELLFNALDQEVLHAQENIFFALSLSYSRDTLQKAYRLWHSPGGKTELGIEILYNIIDASTRDLVLKIFSDEPLAARLDYLKLHLPTQPSSMDLSLLAVLSDDSGIFSEWLKICVLEQYLQPSTQLPEPILVRYLTCCNPILKEVAEMILSYSSINALAKTKETKLLSTLDKLRTLTKVSIFEGIRDEVLSEMAQNLQEEYYDGGTVLFKEGELGNTAYIILSGKVHITKGDNLLAELTDGQCFGEMAILDSENRSATATMVIPSVLLKIDEYQMREFMADDVEIASGIIRELLKRLRETSLQLSLLAQQ